MDLSTLFLLAFSLNDFNLNKCSWFRIPVLIHIFAVNKLWLNAAEMRVFALIAIEKMTHSVVFLFHSISLKLS